MLTKKEMGYVYLACDKAFKDDHIEYAQWAAIRIAFLWCHPNQLKHRPLSVLEDGLKYFKMYGYIVGEDIRVGMIITENNEVTELGYDTYLHIVKVLKRMYGGRGCGIGL